MIPDSVVGMILDERTLEFLFIVFPTPKRSIKIYPGQYLPTTDTVLTLCQDALRERYGEKRLFKVINLCLFEETGSIKILPKLYYVLSVNEETYGISQLSPTWKYMRFPEKENHTNSNYIMEALYVGRDENNWLIYKGGMNNVRRAEDHLPNL